MAKEYTVKDIIAEINTIAAESTQEEWDNSGIQVGSAEAGVKTILTCLEVNRAVVEEARIIGADMIVSHHPLIFGGISKVYDEDAIGQIITTLIKKGIALYSSHTPFDIAKGGNNDVLAQKLELNYVKTVDGDNFLRKGTLKHAMTFEEFGRYVAGCLEIEPKKLRLTGSLGSMVKMVAICTGAGSDYIGLAKAEGCDVLVTGDVKHHEAQTALEEGICIVDAGHYGTEKIFAGAIKEKLEKKLGKDVKIIESQVSTDPFIVL